MIHLLNLQPRKTLTTQTPLIKGCTFTPLIEGVGPQKHYKTSGFRQVTPLIKGVNLQTID